MNNEVSRKVNVGEGLTIHRRPGIAYAGVLHERPFVPVSKAFIRVALP